MSYFRQKSASFGKYTLTGGMIGATLGAAKGMNQKFHSSKEERGPMKRRNIINNALLGGTLGAFGGAGLNLAIKGRKPAQEYDNLMNQYHASKKELDGAVQEIKDNDLKIKVLDNQIKEYTDIGVKTLREYGENVKKSADTLKSKVNKTKGEKKRAKILSRSADYNMYMADNLSKGEKGSLATLSTTKDKKKINLVHADEHWTGKRDLEKHRQVIGDYRTWINKRRNEEIAKDPSKLHKYMKLKDFTLEI